MTVTSRRAHQDQSDQGHTRSLSLLLLPTRPSVPRSGTDLGRITYPLLTKETQLEFLAYTSG